MTPAAQPLTETSGAAGPPPAAGLGAGPGRMGAGERSPGFAPGQLCAGPAAPSTREAPAEDIAAVGVGAVLLGTSEIVIVNKKKL